jgi:Putative F0F1-ATPase subunit Ca2+/Mg2+ transporter
MQQPPPDPTPDPPGSPDDGLGLREVAGLGGLLVGAVVFATLLGWLADAALDTEPALTLAGLALGITTGVVGCWVRVRRFLA